MIFLFFINRDDKDRTPSSPEMLSFKMKLWFCFFGVLNLGFGTLFLFGPWWVKGFSIICYSVAVMCFRTAYQEHKDPLLM